MSFTFSTLLSMIIINAVFVIALNQVVKTSVINYFNIDLFLLSSLVILLRFLLPFEFPFTVSVPVKWGLSYLYDLFVMLEINILGHTINIFTIFMIAWYIGILICGSRLFSSSPLSGNDIDFEKLHLTLTHMPYFIRSLPATRKAKLFSGST